MSKSEASCQVCGEVIASTEYGIITKAKCPKDPEHPVRITVWGEKPEPEKKG